MGRIINIRGHKYNRLEVLRLAPRATWPIDHRGLPVASWIVRCRCGRILPFPIPTADLRHNRRKSCGCIASSGPIGDRICVWCDQDYRGRPTSQYCGEKCRGQARRLRATGRKPYIPKVALCDLCGQKFQAIRYDQIYCSRACGSTAASRRWRARQYELRLLADLTQVEKEIQ